MTANKNVILGFVLVAALQIGAASPRLWAGIEVGGESLAGSHDYTEQTLALRLKIPWRGSGDFEQPLYVLHASRTERKAIAYDGASYTNALGLSAEYLRQAGLDLSFWTTPSFSEDVNSYRWRAWSGSFYVKNDGWWPKISIIAPPHGGPVRSRWSAFYRESTHEERVLPADNILRWVKIGEISGGAGVDETFWNVTTLSLAGEMHSYDKSIAGGIRNGSLFSVEHAKAGLPIEMLNGFPKGAWSVGLKQEVLKGLELSGRYKRYSYETGLAKTGNDYQAAATVSLWALSVSGRYEVFQIPRHRKSEYAGMDVGLNF